MPSPLVNSLHNNVPPGVLKDKQKQFYYILQGSLADVKESINLPTDAFSLSNVLTSSHGKVEKY